MFLRFPGANPNIMFGIGANATMMHFVSGNDNFEDALLLIASGADLRLPNSNGMPVLDVCRRGGFCRPLVERALRNPLKLQHICTNVVVRRVGEGETRRAKERGFVWVEERGRNGDAWGVRGLGLPEKVVEFLEFQKVCMSEPGNGDQLH